MKYGEKMEIITNNLYFKVLIGLQLFPVACSDALKNGGLNAQTHRPG